MLSPFALYALAAARDKAPEIAWTVADTAPSEITLSCTEGTITLRWDGTGARYSWDGPGLGKWAKKITRYFSTTSYAMEESMRLWEAKRATGFNSSRAAL